MSELVVTTLTNQDIQLCKAWVSFNGSGTVAIDDGYKVSSITDGGVGDFTLNFTTAMADTNYCWSGSALYTSTTLAGGIINISTDTVSTTQLQVHAVNISAAIAVDSPRVAVQVFGN